MELPMIDILAKDVAEKALDEITYEGKTLREWVEIIVKQQSCKNYIGKEALIDELKLGYFNKELQEAKNDPCVIDAMIDWAIRTVKRQPSVTPSRPKGHWILIHPLQEDDDGAYICSNCEHGDWDCDTSYKYCPFCGADMTKSEDKQKTSCESCREQVLKHLEKEDWADTVKCVMNMPFMKAENEVNNDD